MAKPLNKFSRAALGFALTATLAAAPATASVINEASLGVTVPQPLASAGDTLNRPVGFTGQAWFQTPNFLPAAVEFDVTLEYLPFAVKNVSGSNSVQINLGMLGAYGGLTVWGGPTVLGIRPYFSGAIGGLYDYLTYPTQTVTEGNSGLAFALRGMTGFDLPLVSHIGLLFEVPMTVAFQKNTLAMFGTSFALRWRL